MPPSLASRLLFHSTQPVPLFEPELNAEVYDFIALSLRAYVSPWWSKISRYDKDFLPIITTIVLKVIAALHSRVTQAHLPSLVFHDVSTILTQHYIDYRNAAAKTCTSYAEGGAADLPTLFAHLQPHMALSSDGIIQPEYYRQIVDHILKVCLPQEDYEPESERIIVREIIVKLLVNDIIPKITQPWFIQKSILDLSTPTPSTNFSFQQLVVIVLSALQSFSGTCLALIHTYKSAIYTIKLVNQSPPRSPKPPPLAPPNLIPPSPKHVSQPPSLSAAPSTASSASSKIAPSTFSATPIPSLLPTTRPSVPFSPDHDYAFTILRLLSEITSASSRFASTFFMAIVTMLATAFSPFLDKLLPHMLHSFLSPQFLLNTTRIAKRTMFPNGYPGPPPIEPTPEEQAEIRAKLVAWRGSGGLALVAPILLGPDPSATLGAALDPLSDPQCNLRLVVFLLDRVLLALFPELGASLP
ncbi:hypothetical protein CVT24_003502 [Panaeolus cyanescens]|uniref:PXA domain-containing protein n=1 Tax=Panaeolus cyanescens TaxID=181874 RepID=A0A409Y7F4_9AGAR|nr:hypothetical protein CVT24_003502 [Panaeolus cyanescens]